MSGTVRVSKLNYQYTEKHYISDKIVKCWLRILLWQSFRNYLCETQLLQVYLIMKLGELL